MQDESTMSIAQSRQNIIQQFRISDSQLRLIEDEGTDKDWPPLDEAMQEVG
jgi:hypothetical protein